MTKEVEARIRELEEKVEEAKNADIFRDIDGIENIEKRLSEMEHTVWWKDVEFHALYNRVQGLEAGAISFEGELGAKVLKLKGESKELFRCLEPWKQDVWGVKLSLSNDDPATLEWAEKYYRTKMRTQHVDAALREEMIYLLQVINGWTENVEWERNTRENGEYKSNYTKGVEVGILGLKARFEEVKRKKGVPMEMEAKVHELIETIERTLKYRDEYEDIANDTYADDYSSMKGDSCAWAADDEEKEAEKYMRELRNLVAEAEAQDND